MTFTLTRGVLEGYLNCKYKGWLRLQGEQGQTSDYDTLLTESKAEVRRTAIQKIVARHPGSEVPQNLSLSSALLKRGTFVILDSLLEDPAISLHFDGLERVQGPSKLGDYHYIPLLFHAGRQVRREQKLLLELYGLFLSTLQKKAPDRGVVWHGKECKATRIHLAHDLPDAQRVLRELKELESSQTPPRVLLNDHCHICEFQVRCYAKAVCDDNLSLLRGMGEKEIRKYHRKGIFTTTQLSCTFRPRKQRKRVNNPTPIHYYALQALAIRDAKTYVYGIPALPTSTTRIYFDVEGDPDRTFAYLLGAVVVAPDGEKRHSFWADGPGEEDRAFQQFMAVLIGLKNFCIYHYGSYESEFLRRMRKRSRRKKLVDNAIHNSLNVLSLLRSNIYFPTFSNGLKDIGACLGFAWTDTGATGIQSIVWRTKWEQTLDEDLKRRLIQYNLDDCAALRAVTEYIYCIAAMGNAADTDTQDSVQPAVAWAHDIPIQSSRPDWNGPGFCLPDLDYVNKCAYFDYQREKVLLRTNPTLRKIHKRSRKPSRRKRLKSTRRIMVCATKCPFCKSKELKRFESRTKTKAAFDLRITRTGVARLVIECAAALHRCERCGKAFLPQRYKKRDKHFHGLKSWAIYQHIVHRVSFQSLEGMFEECFDLRVSYQELHMIKALMAIRYRNTYRGILKKIVSGKLIHADETHVNFQKDKGYVWVLTNLEEVVYLFKPSREGEFLHGLLSGFKGVIVSDFFSAYDSLPCEQQKCLIHLIRDLNHDLLSNPFNEEFKLLVGEFGQLLRLIVSTVDQYGLKKRHLMKHMADVDRFFRSMEARQYESEVAQSYRERLAKNQEKLFTFLRHDDVPWNNNNAEHAVKCYAKYRTISDGKMTAVGLNDYLRVSWDSNNFKPLGNKGLRVPSDKPSADLN